MDVFPLNLVLAVAVAWTTIFFGFLPTRDISSSFFARQSLKAAVAWLAVALVAPAVIFHYYVILALLCLGAWRKFQDNHAFSGKMWLYVASALGISVGVMFLLAVIPRAYPPGGAPVLDDLLLVSIYLGGAVIGLAYVSGVLVRGSITESGITHDLVHHYVRLLAVLALIRAAILLGLFSSKHILAARLVAVHGHDTYYVVPSFHVRIEIEVLLGLVVIAVPLLAFAAYRMTYRRNQGQAAPILALIVFLAFAAEMLARMFAI